METITVQLKPNDFEYFCYERPSWRVNNKDDIDGDLKEQRFRLTLGFTRLGTRSTRNLIANRRGEASGDCGTQTHNISRRDRFKRTQQNQTQITQETDTAGGPARVGRVKLQVQCFVALFLSDVVHVHLITARTTNTTTR